MKEGGLFNRYKFIDDYVLREELGPNGRKINKVYYNREYYVTDWTDKQCRRFRLISFVAAVLSLALSLFPLSVVHEAMTVYYVILWFILSLLMSALMFGSVLQLPKDAQPMERCQKSLGFDKFQSRALINLFSGFCGGVLNAVYAFIVFPKKNGVSAQHPGMDIAVTLSGFAITLIAYLCRRKLRTANLHLSDRESEWDKLCREMAEAEEEAPAEREEEIFPLD